jgi:hypothetical protein
VEVEHTAHKARITVCKHAKLDDSCLTNHFTTRTFI